MGFVERIKNGDGEWTGLVLGTAVYVAGKLVGCKAAQSPTSATDSTARKRLRITL
jgi:hypothetical protein